MPPTDICFLPAVELARRMRQRELSAVEVIEAHLAQIERVNPQVNAIVTLTAGQALADARAADAALAQGEAIGPLHGLPVVHKDLHLTKGVRTTFGSPIYADFVPEEDELIVARLKQAGAISLGKSNTPEFGAGSQTFNPVFGATRNPYDLSKTCGGSSGGAAVALACGMAALADGSDMGGSLRNPASFNNVVGLRPAAGRVPTWPSEAGWATLSVQGPMARSVADLALMLSVIAGPDPRVPIALATPGSSFAQPLGQDVRGLRLAWAGHIPGVPIDSRVTKVLESQLPVFGELGCVVEEAVPDFSDADEVFKIMRAWSFERSYGELMQTHRHQMKDTVIWNIEQGQRLTGPQLGWAERARTALFGRMHDFFQRYDFLLLPVTQVPPFPVEQLYITEINGEQLATYVDWMRSCYYISATGLPAISLPCGFTAEGLPVGLQIVGRHQDEWGLLQLAHAFEAATGFTRHRPAIAG
ncbi:MAG: amidase [Chloroflexaceae bacterium]|jgi:amidase|nr:amidase [Chloroflexaceae bacterium]